MLGAALALLRTGPNERSAETAPNQHGPVYAELEESGIDFVHSNGASGDFLLPEITCAGVALLDYDRDGDLDVYLLQGESLTPSAAAGEYESVGGDRLYRNDMTYGAVDSDRAWFVDVTETSGLPTTSNGFGCAVAVGDFDRDGWQDLYVGGVGSNHLWRNRGDGTFEDRTATSGTDDERWTTTAVWLDYDGDSLLDLYVGNYLQFDLESQKVCLSRTGVRDYCNPDAYVGVADRLLRNRGDGTFEDVSVVAGFARVESKSLGAVVEDFDRDGLDDLYVANDGVANQLWMQSREGGFYDQALLAGCAVNRDGKAEASMGVMAEDFDGDADIDLFMTHLSGETNTFFQNDGNGGFSDRTIASGLGPASYRFTSWGVVPTDFDHDGDLDLAIANGAVRVIDQLVERGDPYPFHQPNQLFQNLGGGRFSDVTDSAGPPFALSEVSRGLAIGDVDNDGDEDLVLANNNGRARVFLNRYPSPGGWLGARLIGTEGGDRPGARITLETARRKIVRRARTDGGFGGAHDPRVVLGLGPAHTSNDRAYLSVLWRHGQEQRLHKPRAARYLTLGDPR